MDFAIQNYANDDPYMAVASQKIIEIRFFVLMRGLFTDAPMSVLP